MQFLYLPHTVHTRLLYLTLTSHIWASRHQRHAYLGQQTEAEHCTRAVGPAGVQRGKKSGAVGPYSGVSELVSEPAHLGARQQDQVEGLGVKSVD